MKDRTVWIGAALLFSLSLTAYVVTLAPGALGGDAGELQFVPYILSLAHPTGYPLQTLLNRLWISIVPVGSIAWRTNLLSAVVAASGISLVYTTVGRATAKGFAGLIAAAALAVSPVYWGQAVLGDKYALNGLLTAGLLWAAWRFYRQPNVYSFAALMFINGLGLAHHRSFLAFAPPLAALIAVKGWPLFRKPRTWIIGCLALASPLLLYLYLPWAAARHLPPHHATITNWPQFLTFMLDAGFLGQVGLLPRISNVQEYITTLVTNFNPLLLLLSAGGLTIRWLRRPAQRGWLAFVLAGFALEAYLTQNYEVPRRFVFFIPAYVCVAVLIGEGVSEWLELAYAIKDRTLRRVLGLTQALIGIAFMILSLNRLPAQWRVHWVEQRITQPMDIWRQDLKTGGQADRLAAALKLVLPRALIVGDWEQATPLWYAQQVEGVCPECIVQSSMLHLSQYAARAAAERRPLYVTRTLNQAADWSEPTAVGPLVYLAPTPAAELPADLVALNITFDNRVLLAGYTWPLGRSMPKREAVLPISLVWQSKNDAMPDYAISLRLTGPHGEIWKEDNPAPVLGMHPFSRLVTGQVITDYYEACIPPEIPAGHYVLTVTLYQILATGGFVNATVVDHNGQVLGESAPVLAFDLARE